ncbi:pyruvate, phosphate dikinase, partial [bacterium]|nr:pyruvate, phosphate dikinase [bacterium]
MSSSIDKPIYFFGLDKNGKNLTEGGSEQKNLLGGKGSNLAQMAKLDLPVPPGFTISTEVCTHFYNNNQKYPDNLTSELEKNLKQLESCMDLEFGSPSRPLLVSVRSGARRSMPGMMDTVLNLGLNDQSVLGLAKLFDNPRFAWDCYRRFIQMYSDVVLDVHSSRFEALLEELKDELDLEKDSDLTAENLQTLVDSFKSFVLQETGRQFPQDPKEQLWGAIGAVFKSWNSSRAIHYRKMESIPDHWGTAVNVQSMVFGNMNSDSATGVAFTRDPSTGKNLFFGEFLENAQGEDVVAGIRTPHPINIEQKKISEKPNQISLEEMMPVAYNELLAIQKRLEQHYNDMQDIEFTIQDKRLFILQTRTGKRTAQAAVKIAIDMAAEKLITQEEALLRVDPYSLDQLLHPRLDPKQKGTPIAKGLPASPGAVSGQVVFSSAEAEKAKEAGEKAILVRHETSPEDINGMDASVGILTALGGMTSHAAVVARGMGKSCIAGCSDIHIDYNKRLFTVRSASGEITIKAGDIITLDANTGELFKGEVPTISSTLDDDFQTLMGWADQHRRLKVRANADTPQDARTARQFGAEGIGLCRTEHMFFDPERIEAVRAMILADTATERAQALETILPMQRMDFISLFREMKGLPVTIRLLDPPLHEFLPESQEALSSLAKKLGSTVEKLSSKARALKEVNPMLGHRGCRLGISFPEIYEMQATAISEAVVEAARLSNDAVQAEIMVPLIFDYKELALIRADLERIVGSKLEAAGLKNALQIGTMIEIPRAAVTADKVAEVADFFSFGTNDLTQMSLGLSRDDSGRFLPEYIDKGILEGDPFASIDVEGVGQFVEMGVQKGRLTKPGLKTGVCGEHGGDPKSIEFFNKIGLDYISCSPFRVPAARLSAAQAAIRQKQQHK